MTQPACHNEADYLEAMHEMAQREHGHTLRRHLEGELKNLGDILGYDHCIEVLARERTRHLCASVAACRGGGT